MNLTLYVVNTCPACVRAREKLLSFASDRKKIKLNVIDVQHSSTKSIIVPALYVEDTLYTYGEIDLNKLICFIESFDH